MDLGPPTQSLTGLHHHAWPAGLPHAASSGAGLLCTLGGAGRLVFPPSAAHPRRRDGAGQAQRFRSGERGETKGAGEWG